MKPLFFNVGSIWKEHVTKLAGIAFLATVWSIFITPLVDQYYLHTFEADSSSVVEFTLQFRAFIHSVNPSYLPGLANYPPYFDGQFLVYAIATDLAWLLRHVGLIPTSLPSDQSLVLFSIRNLHCLCHLISSALLFLSGYHLTRNFLVGIAGGLFLLFSQQLLAINLLRIDHLVLALYTLLLYLAIITDGNSEKSGLRYIFALTAALLMSTKMTSFILAALPLALVLANTTRTRRNLLTFKRPLQAGIIFLAVLFVRYLWQAPMLYANIIDKYQEVKKWEAVLPDRPYFYYLWDVNTSNGLLFLFFSTASVGALSLCICLKWERRPSAIFIAGAMIVLGTLSLAAFKYPRGGYHLLPLSILCGVLVLDIVEKFTLRYISLPRMARVGGGVIIALFIALFVIQSKPAYANLREQSDLYAQTINETRVAPRGWLQAYFPKGTRITVPRHSSWAMPPIFEDGYLVESNFLDFPYLDKAALAKFHPPSIDTMRKEADVVLLNDFHVQCYINFMRDFGLNELAQEWVSFYNQTLAQFPTYRFVGRGRAYEVKEVRIVVINPGCADNQLPLATIAPPPFAR